MTDVLASYPPVTLPVVGGGRFHVRRVFCVGRNYAEHAKEMGADTREPPFFFGKSAEAVTSAADVPYPPATEDLHHEVELVVALAEGGRDLSPGAVRSRIFGYAVGVDLTRRDLQAVAKKLARPWFLAKSFVGAAPTGPITRAGEVGHPRRGAIRLEVDGAVRQSGDLSEMIWSVDEVIANLSTYDTLLPGDLVFTGTPAGVGAIKAGNKVVGTVQGLEPVAFTLR